MRSRLASSPLIFFIVALLTVAYIHGEGQENKEEEEEEEEEEELMLPDCADDNDNCPAWASSGECESNPKYMLTRCKRSCNNCLGERDANPLLENPAAGVVEKKDTGEDLGVPQQLTFPDGTIEQDIYWMINKARSYMKNVATETVGEEVFDFCKNEHEYCAYWALEGKCRTIDTAKYMQHTCAPVCTSCESLAQRKRCALDPNAVDIWQPGDLNKMFERLTSEPYKSKYDVEILASPETDSPWVITMENFISSEEAIRLIEIGYEMGYKRSKAVGKKQPDGNYPRRRTDARTSSTSWCKGWCLEDEHAVSVMDRIEELTAIPQINSEPLQLLRYEEGQFYESHHDYLKYQEETQTGPRIITVFLYLNDVIEGGGTKFDKLNITVAPKRGRAVIWPSVKNGDPIKKDKRTKHQALPVIEGMKYGANAWLHLRDYKTAKENGCTNQ